MEPFSVALCSARTAACAMRYATRIAAIRGLGGFCPEASKAGAKKAQIALAPPI
jgi:hypothetical protein